MTRPLCIFGAMLASLCVAGFYGGYKALPLGAVLWLMGLVMVSLLVRKLDRKCYGLLLAAVMLTVVSLAFRVGDMEQAASYFEGKVGTLQGVVEGEPTVTQTGNYCYTLRCSRVEDRSMVLKSRARVKVYSREPLPVEPLDEILVKAELFRPREAFYEGAFDSRDYNRSKGIWLYASAQPELVMVLEHGRGTLLQKAAVALRKGITTGLDKLEQPAAGLLRGVLLGDKSQLSQKVKEDFQILGISHVLAVSGMHLSILAGLVQLLLVGVLGKRRTGSVVTMLVCFLYASAAAFSPSVTRSLIMHGLMCLALLLMRDYDPSTALAASVCVILLANPLAAGDIGLQLSASTTLGIIVVNEKTAPVLKRLNRNRLGRMVRALLRCVVMTAGALLFSAPLLMLWFRRISLLSFVGNLLIVPWMPLLLTAGGLYCLLQGTPLAVPLAGLTEWLCRLVTDLSGWLAQGGYGQLVSYDLRLVWMLTYLLLLVWGLWWLKGSRRDWLVSGVLAVCTCGLMLLVPSQFVNLGQAEVSFLDVGQGDCAYIECENVNLLVDCGSGDEGVQAGERAAEYIRYYGKDRLDWVVLTHYHSDHMNGLEELCRLLPVGELILPPDDGSENALLVRNIAEQYGIATRLADEDMKLDLGELELTIFTQQIDREAMGEDNQNEQCLVALAECAGASMLFTGDLTEKGELSFCREYDVEADLLKVAHHGSAYSTTYPFLKEVRPHIGVISCREGNSFGHPAEETLYRLAQFTQRVLRVDEKGTQRLAIRDGVFYSVMAWEDME